MGKGSRVVEQRQLQRGIRVPEGFNDTGNEKHSIGRYWDKDN